MSFQAYIDKVEAQTGLTIADLLAGPRPRA